MGILKLLLIGLILSLPAGEIFRLESFIDIPILFNDLFVGLIALIWFIFFIKNRKKEKYHFQLFKPILIFVLICVVSLIINIKLLNQSELIISSLYILRFIFYSILYFLVVGFDNTFKKRILKLMIVITGVIVILGYIQYFLYPNLRNLYYLGWDEHNHRMFSVFLDPNFTGIFFVLGFLLMVGLILNRLKNVKNKSRVFLFILSFITLIAIYPHQTLSYLKIKHQV